MKNTYRLAIVGILAFVIALQPVIAVACGVSLRPSSSSSGWDYGTDSAEQSYIHYENGIEKLIISRDFEASPDGTAWIIPLPSRPTDVETDVLSETPKLVGTLVEDNANKKILDIRDGLLATQLYPLIPKLFESKPASSGIFNGSAFESAKSGVIGSAHDEKPSSVTVYDRLEKEGMVVEVLSTEKADDLYEYLLEKGLSIQKDSIAVLDNYIGQDFTFVSAWIDEPDQFASSKKGLMMSFPTDDIFYPLRPGSVYEGTGMPETINVIGHVTPKLYDNIKSGTSVDYFSAEKPVDLDSFFSSQDDFGFTRITVNTQPQNLTEDLYISPNAPLRITFGQAIATHPVLVAILFLLVIALLAGVSAMLITGLFVKNKPRYLFLNLMGILGILGVIAGSIIWMKEKLMIRILYIAIYSAAFVGLSLSIWLILKLLYPSA